MAHKLQAHLTMIQGIVNRLSQNSFLLKGWSVVLVSALLAVAASSAEGLLVFVAFLPAAAFWGLDAISSGRSGYFVHSITMPVIIRKTQSTMDSAHSSFALPLLGGRKDGARIVRGRLVVSRGPAPPSHVPCSYSTGLSWRQSQSLR